MQKRLIRLSICAAIILISGIFQSKNTAYGAFDSRSPNVVNLRQEDRNGDTQPDVTDWRTQINEQPFSITVYDGGQDMKASGDWSEATDFTNDTWLFDSGANGSYEIVVRFKTLEQARYQALIWDDRDGDQQVSVQLQGTEVEILESQTPKLVVETNSNWTTDAGYLSGKLTFRYDGVLDSEKSNYPDLLLERQLVDYDGNFDFQTIVVDHNNDGLIDYVHAHVLPDVPFDYHIPREGMKVNVGQQAPIMIGEMFYWPLFNYEPDYLIRNYFDSPPFVAIDWSKARIINYGIGGYPVEEGYHINNLNPWKKGVANYANFENMMAYYDLADNDDGLPELHIRNVYWPRHDSINIENTSMDVNEVVYSWRHRSSSKLNWDYKLSLAGSKPITSIVDFEDFSLYLEPYFDLPSWAIFHDWVNTTFVANEDRSYVSSEGIYEWSTTEGVINDYLHSDVLVPDSEKIEKECVSGLGTCDLSQLFTDIGVGLRGEYKGEQGQPQLYFSPIDQRLHLFGAELGIWRITSKDVLKYSDQSGDGVIDTWLLVRDDAVREELRYIPPFLIFSKDNQILFKKTDLPPIQFVVNPPTNHEEWKNLTALLDPFWGTKPKGMEEMIQQASGSTQKLIGAVLSDFRETETGYRFILNVQPGFQNLENEIIPALNTLPEGVYAVTYNFGIDSFDFKPITPPALHATVLPSPLTELQPTVLQVSLDNQGLQDVNAATLELWAKPFQIEATIVASQTVTILAQELTTIKLPWTPPSDGVWTLTPLIRQPDGQTITGNPTQVSVQQTQTANFGNLIPLSVPSKLLPFIILGLISLAAIGSLTFFQVWKRSLF